MIIVSHIPCRLVEETMHLECQAKHCRSLSVVAAIYISKTISWQLTDETLESTNSNQINVKNDNK